MTLSIEKRMQHLNSEQLPCKVTSHASAHTVEAFTPSSSHKHIFILTDCKTFTL